MGNTADIGKVLITQKRAIRIVFGLRKRTSCRKYFRNNKIMTVISLYIYNSLLEIHEEKENLTKNKDRHMYNLRNKDKLHKPKIRLTKVQKQGIYNKICMFNQLPLPIVQLHAHEFKRKIKLFFELNPFYSLNEFMGMRLTESSFMYENE